MNVSLSASASTSQPVINQTSFDLSSKIDDYKYQLWDVLRAEQGTLWSFARILMVAVAFRLLDWIVLRPITNHVHPTMSEHRRWRVRNEGTSFVHSIISGLWALITFCLYPEMWADMINWYSPVTFWLLLVGIGYLLQDAIDLIVHERSLRIVELQFHHFSVIFSLLCAMLSHKYTPIVACGLLMELNSIFLHGRSLCNLHQVSKESLLYRLVSVANIGTFIVFRLSNNVFLLVWDCLHYSVMDSFYFIVLFFVMFSLLIVNLILFYRVLLADSYLQNGCLIVPGNFLPINQAQSGQGRVHTPVSVSRSGHQRASLSLDGSVVVLPLHEHKGDSDSQQGDQALATDNASMTPYNVTTEMLSCHDSDIIP